MIAARTLTDGGQQPLDIAHVVADWLGAAQHSLDIALYDLDLGPGIEDVVTGAIEGAAKRGVAVRLAVQRRLPRADPRAAAAEGAARGHRAAERADARGARDPRPHAPQVRRPRPGLGLDRLDELDGRVVVAGGERDRDHRLGEGGDVVRARLRGALGQAGRDAERLRRAADGARGRRQGAGLVLPRVRRRARAPDREGVRPGEAAHPDLLPGADLRPDSRARCPRSPPRARSTSPAASTRRRSRRSSTSGARTASAPGRSRCSRRCCHARPSRASARRRTRRRACTTTCTRR